MAKVRFMTSLGFLRDVTALDCYAVGYCVANSRCNWELDMSSHLGCTMVEMLKLGLCAESKGLPLVDSSCANIVALKMNDSNLNSVAFDQLADIVSLMTNLRELDVSCNPAGSGGLVKLLQILPYVRSLKTLDISGTTTDCKDAVAMAQLILQSSSITKLRVGDRHIDNMSAEYMMLTLKSVLSQSSLESVDLDYINWTDEAIPLLEKNRNLKELSQKVYVDNSVENLKTVMTIVSKALAKNSSLKMLKFNNNMIRGIDKEPELPGDVVSALSVMLKCNQTLEVLEITLHYSAISPAQILILNDALEHNCTLKQLRIIAHSRSQIGSKQCPTNLNFRMKLNFK